MTQLYGLTKINYGFVEKPKWTEDRVVKGTCCPYTGLGLVPSAHDEQPTTI